MQNANGITPRFYVGIYNSDDMDSNKDCKAVLVFGEQVEPRVHEDKERNWKWVTLACPHCCRVHKFKRGYWYEAVSVSSLSALLLL